MICRLIIFYTIVPFSAFFWHLYYFTVHFFLFGTQRQEIFVQAYLYSPQQWRARNTVWRDTEWKASTSVLRKISCFSAKHFSKRILISLIMIPFLIENLFMLLFWKMRSEPVDVPDLIPLYKLVRDENNVDRFPWKFCNSTSTKSEVLFFVQAFAYLLVITLLSIKLTFFDAACDHKPFRTSLLWRAVGYFMPNPKTMNKIFFTTENVFMPVAGPSGWGKTRLVFSMLTSKTFYRRFEKVTISIQIFNVFREVQKMKIEVINCLDFEMIKTLQDCLLTFDEPCGNYREKKFKNCTFWSTQSDTLYFCQTQLVPPKSMVAYDWPQHYTYYSLQFTTR